MSQEQPKSTATGRFLNCNGVAESTDEIPVSSILCSTDEYVQYCQQASEE